MFYALLKVGRLLEMSWCFHSLRFDPHISGCTSSAQLVSYRYGHMIIYISYPPLEAFFQPEIPRSLIWLAASTLPDISQVALATAQLVFLPTVELAAACRGRAAAWESIAVCQPLLESSTAQLDPQLSVCQWVTRVSFTWELGVNILWPVNLLLGESSPKIALELLLGIYAS